MAIASADIGLGGNVGDVAQTMEQALCLLDTVPGVKICEVSLLYVTTPVGPEANAPFLNAAARLECTIGPTDLLRRLQAVENQAGRLRESQWGARTLDLDLLLYGDTVLREPSLTVPHPHLWYRRFVLDPLAEIAAEARHPLFGCTIRDLQDRLRGKPFVTLLVGNDPAQLRSLSRHLRATFPEAEIETTSDKSTEITQAQGSGPTIILNLDSDRKTHPSHRVVHLKDLPGTLVDAAESVLIAALDEPQRYNRPLRRMP